MFCDIMSKYESKQYMYHHILNGGAIVGIVHQGQIILTPFYDNKIGIGIWLTTEEKEGIHKRIKLFEGKTNKDIATAVEIFWHLASRNTYEFYNSKIIETTGVSLEEPRKRKEPPITVERYYSEHISKGVPEKQAWALAWSRYCKYSYPGSKRCQRKPSQYLAGR